VELAGPVLAQAQVVGPTTLLGPSVVKGTVMIMGLKIAAATVAVLLVLAIGGTVGTWRWLAPVKPAEVGPLLVGPIRPLTGPWPEPRYPSIEAVIAHLPAVDAQRQQRLKDLMEDSARWQGMDADPDWNTRPPGTLTGQMMAIDRALAPLDALLAEGPVRWDATGWIETDYRNGDLGPTKRMSTMFGNKSPIIDWVRKVSRLYALRLLQEPQAGGFPAVTRWVESVSAPKAMMLDYEVDMSVHDIVDHAADLAIRDGRLRDVDVATWLAWPLPAPGRLAVANELAVLIVPQLDDAANDRPHLLWDGIDDGRIIDPTAWWRGQTWTDRGCAHLAGAQQEQMLADLEHRPVPAGPATDGIAMERRFAVVARLIHVGRRLAVVLSRMPQPPVDLDQAGSGIGGQELLRPGPESPGFVVVTNPDGSRDLILDFAGLSATDLPPDVRVFLRGSNRMHWPISQPKEAAPNALP
jgi:hypothetical protein